MDEFGSVVKMFIEVHVLHLRLTIPPQFLSPVATYIAGT